MEIEFKPRFHFKIFLNLIRAVFPRWDFFDQVAYSFGIAFKLAGSDSWQELHLYQNRSAFGLFVNPKINLSLAQINIIEHFAADIQELQSLQENIHSRDVQKLTTFKMLKSMLKLELAKYEIGTENIQFKIIAKSPHEIFDLYISDWIHLGKV